MILFGALIALGGGECFAAARDIPAGRMLVAADVVAVPCTAAAVRPALRYDRIARVPVTAAAVPGGTYLGRLAAPPAARIAPGEMLTLRAAAGPVTVERQVVAAQPGHAGGRMFVRDASGQVFAVRVGAVAP